MAIKRKGVAYTVSTKLQVVVVAEKTSKEAAARLFSVDPLRVRDRSMTLTAFDNYHVVQIVILQTTMLLTALY